MSSSSVYPTVVFVHVLAATALLGSSLSFGLVRKAIRGAATVEELRGWLSFAGRSAAANPAAAIVLLATGVYLGSQGWWTETWFHAALALWFANLLIARRAGAAGAELGRATATAGAGAVPAELDALRWSPRLDVSHDLLLANDVATLFVMFVKPGVIGTAAALAAAHLAAAGLRRRRRSDRWAAPARAGEGVSMARS